MFNNKTYCELWSSVAFPRPLVRHVHVVVVARPIAVIGSVHHARRDRGQQRCAVRTHAEVTQQHFGHGVRPRRSSVLIDHHR